jgi:FdhD protein
MFRWQGGKLVPGTDAVVAEATLAVKVNGRVIADLLCSPADLEYLGLGFLKVEGFINTAAEVKRRGVSKGVFSAAVIRALPPGGRRPTRLTGCAGGISFRATGRTPSPYDRAVNLMHLFSAEKVLARSREFLARDATHRETGGTHSAALSTADELLAFASDIGRHNAVQKLAGWALLHRPVLDDAFLLCTGRISSEMVRYARTMGIPLIASRAATTLLGIQEADAAGITLAGFVRGGRMNVYAHPERVA